MPPPATGLDGVCKKREDFLSSSLSNIERVPLEQFIIELLGPLFPLFELCVDIADDPLDTSLGLAAPNTLYALYSIYSLWWDTLTPHKLYP